MKIFILAVGNRMPNWVDTGFTEYAKRMPHELSIELIEIKPEKRNSSKNLEKILALERGRINAALVPGCRTIVLDEHGAQWSTVNFTKLILESMEERSEITFVIGGADGLHCDIKRKGNMILALSAMTLPHGLARVLLVEQLFRAASIIKRHPYHRA